MIGLRFARLTVIDAWRKSGANSRTCRVKCDCGGEKIVNESNLRAGATKSCGCLLREHRANMVGVALRQTLLEFNGKKQNLTQWASELDLALSTIVQRLKRELPLDVVLTKKKLPRGKKGHLLTFNGKTQNLSAWAREIGVTSELIRQRLANGLPIEQVLAPRKAIITDLQRANMSKAQTFRYRNKK